MDGSESNLLFIGIGNILNSLSTDVQKELNDFINNFKNNPNLNIIIYGNILEYKKIRTSAPWYSVGTEKGYIFIGDGIFNQTSFTAPDVDYQQKKKTFECMGYVVYQGKSDLIKFVVDGDGNNGW